MAETGQLSLPMREPQRTRILDVRNGKVPMREVLDECSGLEAQLSALREGGALPEADAFSRHTIESFVIGVYLQRWA